MSTITFYFWAVQSRKPDHFMAHCAGWPLAHTTIKGYARIALLFKGLSLVLIPLFVGSASS